MEDDFSIDSFLRSQNDEEEDDEEVIYSANLEEILSAVEAAEDVSDTTAETDLLSELASVENKAENADETKSFTLPNATIEENRISCSIILEENKYESYNEKEVANILHSRIVTMDAADQHKLDNESQIEAEASKLLHSLSVRMDALDKHNLESEGRQSPNQDKIASANLYSSKLSLSTMVESPLRARLNSFSPSFQSIKVGTNRPGAAVAAAAAYSRQGMIPKLPNTLSSPLSNECEVTSATEEDPNVIVPDKSSNQVVLLSKPPDDSEQVETVNCVTNEYLDNNDPLAGSLRKGPNDVSPPCNNSLYKDSEVCSLDDARVSDEVDQSAIKLEQSNTFQEDDLLPHDIKKDERDAETVHITDNTQALIQEVGINLDDSDYYADEMHENGSNLSDLDTYNLSRTSIQEIETTYGLSGENPALLHLEHHEVLDGERHKAPEPLKSEAREDSCAKTALNVAEEAEKRAAFSGLHLEEGAAAQPMRLEGIQKGPPAIGFLHVDSTGPVSQALASPTTIHEYGTAQALAVHSNYIAVGLSKGTILVKNGDSIDTKVFFPSNVVDKSYAAVTSLSFNIQGDLLLVGHSNGSLVLWDVPRGTVAKVVSGEHSAAVVHALFLGQDLHVARNQKAISADCKGLVLLHTFTVVPLFRRFSITTQCLLDGQRTGLVLSLSPLLPDEGSDSSGGSSTLQPAVSTVAPAGLGSRMGGMVGGIVAGKNLDTGKRFLHDVPSSEDAGGVVVFVTYQTILVVRLSPSLEVCAKMPRPDGIRDGAIPYTAWRRTQSCSSIAPRGSSMISASQGVRSEPGSKEVFNNAHNNSDDIGDTENQPILALAWDRKVFILQLSKGELRVLVAWNLDSIACGTAWLEEQMVVVLTSDEQLCLFTKDGLEVERANLKHDKLGTETAISSHAFILNSYGKPEKTYHNSLAVRAAELYLLGPAWLWKACLLPWQDRIKALQNAGDWMGAFHIAMEVYDGRTLGVIGLPRGLDALREAVIPTLLELLFAYMDEAFTYLSLAFGNSSVEDENLSATHDATTKAKEQYARVGGVAIEFCVHIGQTHVLFDRVFNKFCSVGQRGTFLELLEPYILKDMLGALAPEVMQALVEHYSQRGWLQRVEQCVLHMDIASLDFNQVVRLCRENGLYSALIYLFNKGLDDFKSPLEELLFVAQDTKKPNAQAYGYKMLVYLKYCFSGLAFPPGHGYIASSRLPSLRAELLKFLLEEEDTGNTSSQHVSRNHPRLSYLLSLDMQATLEVLHCAFPKDGILGIGEDGSLQKLLVGSADLQGPNNLKDGIQLVQAVVDALANIVETMFYGSSSSEHVNLVQEAPKHVMLSKHHAGCIIEFITKYVASRHAKVSRSMLGIIVEYLTCMEYNIDGSQNEKGNKDKKRKEHLLVSLLKGASELELDFSHTLELARQAQFWQASACLFAKRGDYVAALRSYLEDKEEPHNLFMFIFDVLNPANPESQVASPDLKKSVLGCMPQLFQLSSDATLVVILKHFSKEHKLILSELAPFPALLFQYLKKIMAARSYVRGTLSTTGDTERMTFPSSGVNCNNQATYQSGSLDACDKTVSFLKEHESLPELLQRSGLEFTDEMAELYLELLCQFEPQSVLKFLESYENYRLEHCLRLCQDYGINDAAVFLLERVGDIWSALSLVLSDMDHHIHDMDASVAFLFAKRRHSIIEDTHGMEKLLTIPEVERTQSVLQAAIGLCQRNTLRVDPVESEALWFRLLDRFVEPLRKLNNARRGYRRNTANRSEDLQNKETNKSKELPNWKVLRTSSKAVNLLHRILVHMMSEIVKGMMGYVPLTVIMDKLLSENASHQFGDFKKIILEILSSYGYEQAILCTAKHLVEDDTFENINALKRRSSKAYAPHVLVCCVCNHGLYKDASSLNGSKTHSNKLKNIVDDGEGITRLGKAAENIRDPDLSSSCSTNDYDSIVIFFCGHAAHSSCICENLDMTCKITGDKQSPGCPVCAPNRCLLDLSSEKRIQRYKQKT